MIVNARTTRRTRPTSTNLEFSTEPGAYTFWITAPEKFILLNFVSIEVFGPYYTYFVYYKINKIDINFYDSCK